MIKPSLLTGLVAALSLASGCGMFSKKNAGPKENPAIASDVEETFRRRWMDKRVGELTAQGMTPDTARAQADKEFRDRYAFDRRDKK